MALKWLSGGLSSSRETVHFVTWRVSSWQTGLSEAERDTVARVIRQRKDQYGEVLSFVVMDDHVHVLMKCDMTVERVVETWKSFSAHHLRELHGRSGAVWQRDTFHRPIRDEDDLRARSRYIAANPWKRWPFVGRYPWVWESGRQAQAFRPERAGVFASLAHLVTGNAK
jgi:REP element-mobilizing transposase RayT